MTARQQPPTDRPAEADAPAPPVPVDAPVQGFHWEFSDAESTRFGEAILSAIACDDRRSAPAVA